MPPDQVVTQFPVGDIKKHHTADYLAALGIQRMPARTSVIDPGYSPAELESHLDQSAHLIEYLKISMACWIIANEAATRRKVATAKKFDVPTCTGGGPFEIAATFGKLEHFLDLCADIGVDRIEAGEGFTDISQDPSKVVRMATDRGLEVQFEIGKKHGGAFDSGTVQELIEQGMRWLDAGAKQIIVEARENAANVGLFDAKGQFNGHYADAFVDAFGFDNAVFEAPNKSSQFAMLNHFGPSVKLCNIRVEELLRVEIYRRGLHSDAFLQPRLRPNGPGKGE